MYPESADQLTVAVQQADKKLVYLMDTCLTAQDNYKALLDYFKVRY